MVKVNIQVNLQVNIPTWLGKTPKAWNDLIISLPWRTTLHKFIEKGLSQKDFFGQYFPILKGGTHHAFLRPKILQYAHNLQWDQNSIFSNSLIIFYNLRGGME